MVTALADISPKQTISTTTYSLTPIYKVTAPNDNYILLSQISLGADSNFLNDGFVDIEINGNKITSNSNALNEVQLISNLSIEFGVKDFIFIEPGSSLNINCRISSGSGTVQFAVTGTVVTKNEFQALRNKYLGVTGEVD